MQEQNTALCNHRSYRDRLKGHNVGVRRLATLLHMLRRGLIFQNLQSSGALSRVTRVLSSAARFRKKVRCEVRFVGRVQHAAASARRRGSTHGFHRFSSLSSAPLDLPYHLSRRVEHALICFQFSRRISRRRGRGFCPAHAEFDRRDIDSRLTAHIRLPAVPLVSLRLRSGLSRGCVLPSSAA